MRGGKEEGGAPTGMAGIFQSRTPCLLLSPDRVPAPPLQASRTLPGRRPPSFRACPSLRVPPPISLPQPPPPLLRRPLVPAPGSGGGPPRPGPWLPGDAPRLHEAGRVPAPLADGRVAAGAAPGRLLCFLQGIEESIKADYWGRCFCSLYKRCC